MYKNKTRCVYYWLLTGCLLIGIMVIIGGITRLTRSGLSIVEWKPIEGTLPPMNLIEWQEEFELYQKSPEFKFYNNHFTLDDFKHIYFWEYLHRLIARVIGVVFIIPCIIFWKKDFFDRVLKKRVLFILAGGLFQGFLGWFMVKSGLIKDPHVSHYRLMTHLLTAILLIVYIYQTALIVKYEKVYTPKKTGVLLKIVFGLILLQIIYGAFVAGLKAGLMYNTFPKMGESWIAQEVSYGFKQKGTIALVESHAVVQLIHRFLGISCLVSVCMAWMIAYRKQNLQVQLYAKLSFLLLLQVILGITTLLLAVPISWGVLHQAFAIVIVVLLVQIHFKEKYLNHIPDVY